jgi:hypothetical protein
MVVVFWRLRSSLLHIGNILNFMELVNSCRGGGDEGILVEQGGDFIGKIKANFVLE